MRKRFLALSSALFCILAFGLASASAADQPRMQAAKTDLEAAKSELEHAEHNKGGHRSNAIGFVNAAIAAVNRGIAFDRRHNHAESATNFSGTANSPDQPHMRAALTNLQNARRNLEEASSDKGGYRKNALELVNKAISEVNKGIAVGN